MNATDTFVERRRKRRHTWPELFSVIDGQWIPVRNWCRFGLGLDETYPISLSHRTRPDQAIVQVGVIHEAPTRPFPALIARRDTMRAPLAVAFSNDMPEVKAFFDRLYLWRYQCEMAIHWIRFWSIKRHLYASGISDEFGVPVEAVSSVFQENWKPSPEVADAILEHMRAVLHDNRPSLKAEDFMNDPAFVVRRTAV